MNIIRKNIIKKMTYSIASLSLIALAINSLALAQDSTSEISTPTAPREMTADESQINDVLQEVFWRVKANDNSAFYENEFSYLRKEMTLDKYLTGVSFRQSRKPNSDSIVILTLDSAVVVADSARAYITLTIDDGQPIPPRYLSTMQHLFREKGQWIKPLLTNTFENDKFYRQVEMYEEDAERESGN